MLRSGTGRRRACARRAPPARAARLLLVGDDYHDGSLPRLGRGRAGWFAHPEMVLARTRPLGRWKFRPQCVSHRILLPPSEGSIGALVVAHCFGSWVLPRCRVIWTW